MEEQINYYGIDQSYQTVEHGPASIDQALEVIDKRFANLKPQYETAEEAIAETMFGFCRSVDTFIEICIHSHTQIAFKLEIPRSKKFLIFRNVYQKETELKSKEEVIAQVNAFFSQEIEQYRKFLESHCQ